MAWSARTVPAMSANGMSGLSVARPTGVCAATGTAFVVGERFVATLVERAGQPGFERVDYSVRAWEGGARPEAPLRLFGSWRTTMPAGDREQRALMSDDELLELFEEMGGTTEPKHLAFRFVLALMLVRRRVLRMMGERRTGDKRAMLVRPRGESGETPAIEVADPGMDEATINEVIEQLGQVIGEDAGTAGGSPA